MNIINIILLIISLNTALALSNGLALTPPLLLSASAGCQADEAYVFSQADLLISQGLASKGYKYVLIEPCWQVLMVISREVGIKMEISNRTKINSHRASKN